jgi:FtsH-binding integral membrane protein
VTTATSLRTVKPLAFLTALMSIPLLLSYQINYQRFPEGLPYLFLYFGGLTSVFLTPALLVLSVATTIRIRTSSDLSNKTPLLAWNLAGILVGSVAEFIFLLARKSQP